jgi:acyl-CoA thioester hydrolase
MELPVISTSVNLKIPFHDVDSMEVVWHGNYLKYFEIARCQLLDEINCNYINMRDSGYSWPVYDARVRYMHPLIFNQDVIISAILSEYENRLKINFEITDEKTGLLHAKGSTMQVAIDMESGEMLFESPEVFIKKLKELE